MLPGTPTGTFHTCHEHAGPRSRQLLGVRKSTCDWHAKRGFSCFQSGRLHRHALMRLCKSPALCIRCETRDNSECLNASLIRWKINLLLHIL